MSFEEQLRHALRREDPGPGFTAGVLARAEAEASRPRWWHALWRPTARWTMAACCVLLLMAGVLHYRREQQRSAGERARQQVMTALRLAGEKLQFAQARVYRLQAHKAPRGQL